MNRDEIKAESLREYERLTEAYFRALRVREVFRIRQLAAERESALRRLFTELLGREPSADELRELYGE